MKKGKFSILFGLAVCLLLTSCNGLTAATTGSTASTTQPRVTTQPQGTTAREETTTYEPPLPRSTNYSIEKIGEKYYISLETPEYYMYEYDSDYSQILPGVWFLSYEDFCYGVRNKQLTEDDLFHVIHFSKDDFGIPMCDLDNLLAPILHEDMETNAVVWVGESYYQRFDFPLGELGYALFYPESEFEALLQTQPWDELGGELLHQEQIEDRGAIASYYTNSGWNYICIQYELAVGEKTMHVREIYNVSKNGFENGYALDENAKPSRVNIFCDDQGLQCLFSLSGFHEKPTIEWLKGFGVEKYVPTPVEE